MAVVLSRSGVTSVTFSRATTFPSSQPRVPNQFIGISDDDTVRAASISTARRIITLEFQQLSKLDRTNLEAFFEDPGINWALNSFTLTTEFGTQFTVRFLESEFVMPDISEDNVSLSLNLTVVKE